MRALLNKHRSQEDGFTLIELLIVIIILGILAAIVVFAVASTRKDSVASSCKTDFRSIELSADAVNTKSGSYPTTASVDSINGSAPFTVTPVADTSNALVAFSGSTNGALLKTWPSSTDYQFYYQQTGSGSGMTITVYKPVSGGGTAVPATPTNTAADCDSL